MKGSDDLENLKGLKGNAEDRLKGTERNNLKINFILHHSHLINLESL
jgi:hypothetical protein